MVQNRRNKRNAGAVPVSFEELERVKKQQELEEQQQKARATWNVLLGQTLLERLHSELDDVRGAISETMAGKEIRNSDGIKLSEKTLRAKLKEYYMSYRKMFYDQVAKERELREAWKVEDADLQAFFNEKVLGKAVEEPKQ